MRVSTSRAGIPLLGLLMLAARPDIGAAAAGAVPCVQAALDALAARGIAIDTNEACRAALLAVARTADPRAELRDLHGLAAPPVSSVAKAEAWAEDVRYLKLRGLAADAATNVEERVVAWLKQPCAGVVLDVRNAGGEELAVADRLAAFFTGETGTLYVVRSPGRPPEPHAGVSPSAWRVGVPLLVLTDRDTRDGSELLAALLRGRTGVMLLGTATRGDAAAREVVTWGEPDGLWIATGKIDLARGPAYDPGGVKPDVEIERTPEPTPPEKLPEETAMGRPLSARSRADRELLLQTAGDATLRRALEILFAVKAVRVQPK